MERKLCDKGNECKGDKALIRGYMTVEAAMVMPIVLGTIVFIICLQLFWFNQCLMDQQTARIAIYVAQARDTGQKEVEKLLQGMEYADAYVAWDMSPVDVSLKQNHWQISRAGKLLLDGGKIWETKVAYETVRCNPTDFLRTCRKIGSLNAKEEE